MKLNGWNPPAVQILKLNIGNPAPFGFRTPDEVIYDMRQQLTECEGYSPAKGLFAARKAIMQYAQLKNIPNVTIEDIYTGNGVSELINLSMSALLDDGDEILIPSPDYPLWTACCNACRRQSRPLSLRRAGQTGILTLPTFEKRSRATRKRSSSSIPTIRPARFIRRKFWKESWKSRVSTI